MAGPKDGTLGVKKDQFHDVEIRVIIEQLTRGKPKESVALAASFHCVDLIGKTVVLENVPPRIGKGAEPKAPAQWLSAVEEWLPTLRTGQTLGILDNGLHGDVLAENAVLTFLHTCRTVYGIKAISLAQVPTFKTIGELQACLGLAYTAANADRIRVLVDLWELLRKCKEGGLL